jgi:hypothetical protein
VTQDPKRLIVSEHNDLGLGLASARRQLPSEIDLTRLARRLAEAGVAVPAELSSNADVRLPAPARAPHAGLRFKLYAGVGIGVVALCAALAVRRERAHSSQSAVGANVRAPSALGSSVSMGSATTAEPLLRPSPALPSPESERPAPVRAAQPATIPETSEAVVEPRAAPPVEAARDTSRRAPASAPSSSRKWTPSGPTTYAAPTEPSTPTNELELVKQARNALNSDPARAYALTERCRAEFPKGAFGQEREYIAITALARLGRDTQARALANSFKNRYPRSVYVVQLERLLGSE